MLTLTSAGQTFAAIATKLSGLLRATTEVRLRPARADFACPRWLLELWRLTMNA